MKLKAAVVLSTLIGTSPIAANATVSVVAADLGVYDSENNVTWTSNANLMATQAAAYPGGPAAFVSEVIAQSNGVIHDSPNIFDTTGLYRLSANDFNTAAGTMSWWGAQAWAHYLNVVNYGGLSQWALPTTVDNASSTGFPDGQPGDPSQSSSQMAELFYGGLGQIAGGVLPPKASALFINFSSANYWSGTESSADPRQAWHFRTGIASQSTTQKTSGWFALAVSPGQLGATTGASISAPIPLWALGILAVGLLALARRRLRVAA